MPRLPIADKSDWGTTYLQRPLLFRNLDGKKFRKFRRSGSGLAPSSAPWRRFVTSSMMAT